MFGWTFLFFGFLLGIFASCGLFALLLLFLLDNRANVVAKELDFQQLSQQMSNNNQNLNDKKAENQTTQNPSPLPNSEVLFFIYI